MNDNSKLSIESNMISSCFVVSGYGERFDSDNRRMCNLDDVYENVIVTLMKELDIKCFRTDKIYNSGSFDSQMYNHLLNDDLTIVNITTLNANAMFELGVRYTLKPHYTILIMQEGTKIPVNINHIKVYSYNQNPEGMTNKQIIDLKNKLRQIIVMLNCNPAEKDSPVYFHIPGLKITYDEYKTTVQNNLDIQLNDAIENYRQGNFKNAESKLRILLNFQIDDYIINKLAVCIYKQNEFDFETLKKAKIFITSNVNLDSETYPPLLSTYAAIMKKIWYITDEINDLFESEKYFDFAYSIGGSYYSGVNLAYVQMCCANALNGFNRKKYKGGSLLNYEKVRNQCLLLIENNKEDFWLYRTLAECEIVLNGENVNKYIEESKKCKFSSWMEESSLIQIERLKKIIENLERD